MTLRCSMTVKVPFVLLKIQFFIPYASTLNWSIILS